MLTPVPSLGLLKEGLSIPYDGRGVKDWWSYSSTKDSHHGSQMDTGQ